MIYSIINWRSFIFRPKQRLKHWSRPATLSLAYGVLTDLTRSRSDQIVEYALLHQQLIFLQRQVKRPLLTARFSRFWKQALHIIQPNPLLRWHRELFRFYWRRKSKSKQNQTQSAA